MIKISFIDKPKQLYYLIESIDVDKRLHIARLLILLKNPTDIFYSNEKNFSVNEKRKAFKNVLDSCFIKKNEVDIVKNIMKSNQYAIQYLRNENVSLSDLAQLKVSYGGTIKSWNKSWQIVN